MITVDRRDRWLAFQRLLRCMAHAQEQADNTGRPWWVVGLYRTLLHPQDRFYTTDQEGEIPEGYHKVARADPRARS